MTIPIPISAFVRCIARNNVGPPKIRRLKAGLGIRKNLGLGQLLTGWNARTGAREAVPPQLVAEMRDVFREDYETVRSLAGIDIRATPFSLEQVDV